MEALLHDLRYGLRTLVRQPGFALTAVFALALGIGANTAVFSVVYAVLLRPLPYPDPAALVYVHDTYPAVTFASVSVAKYVALRDRNSTLVALGAGSPVSLTLTGGGPPEQVGGSTVSADLFKVMQVTALAGRWFSAEEDAPNGNPVIVLSYSLWQRRLGGNRSIVGTPITVDGQARTVVGVMPQGFTYPGQTQAWIPLAAAKNAAPGGNFLRLVGRMRPGVTVDQVQRDLLNVSAEFNRGFQLTRDVKVWPLHEILVSTNRQALLVLQGAVAFVLLVACANVANLLLARSVSRQRELAIRSAIGASRSRIVRQLLTESVLLSVVGGTVGVLLASWLVRLFLALAPTNFPRAQAITIDTGVLTFTLGLATLTGLLFGLAPALRGLRVDPNDGLRDVGARGATSAGTHGASRALVIAEVSLTIVLVVGAGLMVKSLLNLQHQSGGFQSDGLLTFEINLPAKRYPNTAPAQFFQRLMDEIQTIPGVQSAGAINYLPISNFGFNGGFSIQGRPPFAQESAPVVEYRMVTPGYFSTMGIPLRRGRAFNETDTASSMPVVIINEAMANRYWPNADPVGARVQLSVDTTSIWREVVGVAGDVRSWNIGTPPVPESFVPHAQVPIAGMGVAVRLGELDTAKVLPAIRQRVAQLDAGLPLVRVRPMKAIVDASAGSTRLSSVLTSVFALVAALLATVGIYSLIAYSVAQRTRELGIRMALGADRGAVIRLIVGEGLLLTSIGIAVGISGALLLTRLLETLLYDVSPTDPGVLALTAVGVLTIAALASLIPAARALRVDPMAALRAE
jgi:putative ABC transport system permease protein